MTVYRLARQRYAQDLSGHGARRVGGRHNPVGVSAVYTAENISLAILEVLVHLDKQDIPDDYVLMAIQLAIAPVAVSDVRQAVETGRVHPVVAVPSAVVPRERNIVIYPEFAGFNLTADLTIAWTEPFRFDPRLFSASAVQ